MKKIKFNVLIEEADTIAILGHVNPDGDCLGSALGCKNYIKNRYPGKKVNVYLQDSNKKFAYLPGYEDIINTLTDRKYDLVIVTDCADKERLGKFSHILDNGKKFFVVDHHKSNDLKIENSSIIPDASSASEVIFDLMFEENVDRDVATCLYTGIVHDTGVFKYTCTGQHTMEIAGFLISKGINFTSIIDDSFYMKSFKEQRLLGIALKDAELLLDGRLLVSHISGKDMKKFSATSKETDGIVSILRQTKGIDCAAFIYDTVDAQRKISLRSDNEMLDVSLIAAQFGGGGHKMAAGCMSTMSYEDIKNKIIDLLLPVLEDKEFRSNNEDFQDI